MADIKEMHGIKGSRDSAGLRVGWSGVRVPAGAGKFFSSPPRPDRFWDTPRAGLDQGFFLWGWSWPLASI